MGTTLRTTRARRTREARGDGDVVARFRPLVAPDDEQLTSAIEEQLPTS